MIESALFTDGGVLDDDLIPASDPTLHVDEDEALNSMDVTRRLQAIRMVEKMIAQYEQQANEAKVFYADRVYRCQRRIEDVKRNILGFLQQNDMKNIQTPFGTAYQRLVTTKLWPTDDALLSWAVAHNPATIRVKREPDKRAISDHIKSTGEIPPGYNESQEVRLYIK